MDAAGSPLNPQPLPPRAARRGGAGRGGGDGHVVRAARRLRPGRAALSAASVLVPAAFLGVFLAWPLARILGLGLENGGFAGVAADVGLGKVLGASALQALLSTVACLAVGIPAAWVFGRFDFPGKAALRVLVGIPFVLPTLVVSAAFVQLLGAGSILAQALRAVGLPVPEHGFTRTLGAVIAAHTFYNAGIVVRVVGSAWSSLDPRLADAARTLGAGRWRAFLRVTLPLLLPALLAAALLVFAFCFSSFGVILVLGGPRMATLETEIYRQAVGFFDLRAAAFLSIVQLLVSGTVMAAYARLQAATGASSRSRPETAARPRPRTPGQKALVALVAGGLALVIVVPMLVLAAGSLFLRGQPSLAAWAALFGDSGHSLFWTSPLRAAGNSLRFALAATGIALALGIPASYAIARPARAGRRARGAAGSAGSTFLDVVFLLPLGTSAVTLGFGYIVALGAPPLSLAGAPVLIPIAHALVALPLVVRTLLPAQRSLNPRLREAAGTLGAGPWSAWRWIELPMLARSFGTAAAFAFTVSLGEFGATAILTRPELVTLPVLVFGALSRPGVVAQGQALAAATLLMLLCGLGLAAIERLRPSGRELF